MFRRLAEAFQTSGGQSQYVNNQNTYFNTLPNVILSGTSGLKGFDVAIQSADTYGNTYQPTVVKNPNDIFIQDSSPSLNKLAKQCSSASIDDLLAIKNPNAAVGCGWLYSPPNQGSPYPTVSNGFIGKADGPLQNFSPPDYKKWYFDLQLAKKQILLDKCKALKSCGDVDSAIYNGICGYCTDTNQGIPIDVPGATSVTGVTGVTGATNAVGAIPLYGGDPRGNCSPQSIVTSGANCPPPPGTGPGPQPVIDNTCQPVNGRLSSACLYNQVLSAGCSDNGTLAIALAAAPPPDYIYNIRNGDAVKIYNLVANPPLNLDVFSQGATTVDIVLNEARQLFGNTKQPSNTSLGAAARDLCLQTGSINNFNFCSDLPDSTPPPFDVNCLQNLFLTMGGQPSGASYPNTSNITTYNTMLNLGAVKQYLNGLVTSMNSIDYNTQRNAMIQFLGITPQSLIVRAPYNQGVEVLWFTNIPGQPNKMAGFLKRTIETDIVQFALNSMSIIPQLALTYPGFTQYTAMLQMFDVRAPGDFTAKFNVTVDDGFWIAVNQEFYIDIWAQTQIGTKDNTGFFSNIGIQGATTYSSNNISNYFAATPNITKIFYEDAGGGGHTLQVKAITGSGSSTFSKPYYSLTLEPRAPFINFEAITINNLGIGNMFGDTRNPGLFGQNITSASLDIHTSTDDRSSVPGNKGFVRFTNNTSYANIMNIAYQSWNTVTFAVRLQSMPVQDAIFSFFVSTYKCILYLQPINGSTAQLRVQTNMTTNNTLYDGTTNFTLQLGSWYYLQISQNGQGFDIFCDSINNIVTNNNFTTTTAKITNSKPITTTASNGLQTNSSGCSVAIGGKASGLNFYSGTFQFDLAWVHFYDYYITTADVVKDCNCTWIFTQAASSLNTYSR